MKNLTHYINVISNVSQEADMKQPRIMAEQVDGHEEPYNSTKDRWSRRAKHPMQLGTRCIDSEQWMKGDMAIYEGEMVEVSIPNGPNSTIGIIVEGHTKMVKESSLKRLEEGVMGGVMAISPLNRIMQLAGLSSGTSVQETEEVEEVVSEEDGILEEADATNMFNSLFKANMSGEFRNNPDAARMATVGQILVGLESQIKEVRGSVDAPTESKLDAVLGIGAVLIKSAREKLKPEQG